MITPSSLAVFRFGFHGGDGFAFLLIFAIGIAAFVWALIRFGRNSA